MKMTLLMTTIFLAGIFSTARAHAQKEQCSAGFKYNTELDYCVPKNTYVQYYDSSYEEKLRELSSSALRGEYAKKLTAWGVSCIPDAIKIGISATLESVPIASAFNFYFGGIIHSMKDRPNGGYGVKLTDEISTRHAVTETILGAPVSWAVLKVYDKAYSFLFGDTDNTSEHNPKNMEFYWTTRTFAHDSFDPQYASLCSKQAVAISQIRHELASRKNGAQVQPRHHLLVR